MKVRAHILQSAFLTGALAAQTAPASQTVNQNPPPSQQNPSQAQVKKDSTTAKIPAKNPFKPKPKTSQPATQPTKSPQPAATTATTKAQTKTPAPAQKAAPSQATAKPSTPKPPGTPFLLPLTQPQSRRPIRGPQPRPMYSPLSQESGE